MSKHCYDYPRPSVTVDLVVFARDKTNHCNIKVLLIKRGKDPFEGQWAIPGGFFNEGETTEQAAKRELKEETGCELDSVKLIGVYSDPNRDPRGQVITIAYLAELDDVVDVEGRDDAAEARWFDLGKLRVDIQQGRTHLAFDHDKILVDAIWKRDR
jgi:8-oxo-dGTP diphosphatase